MFMSRRTPSAEPATGANSKAVQKRSKRAAETEALAVLAEREHYARQQPAYRALALDRIRTHTMLVGALLMLGLGAWSAVGVHHGVAAGAAPWTADWVLGWVLEPVLLAGVALIVIVRSTLALVGARLTPWAWVIELALLGLSLAANVRALPVDPGGADYVLRLTGPVGCLLVSMILVAVDKAVREADIKVRSEYASSRPGPWADVFGRAREVSASAAQHAVDKVADRLVDSGADSSRTVSADSSAVSADSDADSSPQLSIVPPLSADSTVHGSLSTAMTSADSLRTASADSADSGVDSGVDSGADSVHGQCNQVSADSSRTVSADSADSANMSATIELPATRAATMTLDEAVDTVREIDADTLDGMSIRALAEHIGCGKTTAGRARAHVLGELAAATDQDS